MSQFKVQQNNFNYMVKPRIRKSNLSCLNNIKNAKTFKKECSLTEKKITQIPFKKKNSEIIRNIDFELRLKNKNNLVKTQYNLFSPDKFTNTQFCGSDYCEYTLDCMNLILKKDNSQRQQKNKINFNFPKSKGNIIKKIALFDLDETLVHCTGDISLNNDPYQHCIEVVLPGNKEIKVGINIRPFWKKTLNLIKKYYHIIVFTASHQAYADAVLNFMDPSNKYFKYRLYRNNCSLVDIEGTKFYVKDLDIFDEHYNLKDIIIIDNSVLSFIYHLENGIPIVPYYDEDKDDSLYVVGLYLKHIFKENDLREANKKYINLDSFLNEAKLRNETENSIKEESTNSNINEDEYNIKNKDDIIKVYNNKNNVTKIKKEKGINIYDRKNLRRCSFSVENSQKALVAQSKLIKMFYEINSKKSLSDNNQKVEEKSNKSFSSEEESNIKKNESIKNISDLFFQKRLLTAGEKPIIIERNTKSNKNVENYVHLKTINSNFFDNFTEKFILNK